VRAPHYLPRLDQLALDFIVAISELARKGFLKRVWGQLVQLFRVDGGGRGLTSSTFLTAAGGATEFSSQIPAISDKSSGELRTWFVLYK